MNNFQSTRKSLSYLPQPHRQQNLFHYKRLPQHSTEYNLRQQRSSWRFYRRMLFENQRNQTTRGQTVVIGNVWSSTCSGWSYNTFWYTWTNALVYFQYEISLYDYDTHPSSMRTINTITSWSGLFPLIWSMFGFRRWIFNLGWEYGPKMWKHRIQNNLWRKG